MPALFIRAGIKSSKFVNSALENTNRDELGKRGYEAYKSVWSKRAHFERYFQLIHAIVKEADSIKPIS